MQPNSQSKHDIRQTWLRKTDKKGNSTYLSSVYTRSEFIISLPAILSFFIYIAISVTLNWGFYGRLTFFFMLYALVDNSYSKHHYKQLTKQTQLFLTKLNQKESPSPSLIQDVWVEMDGFALRFVKKGNALILIFGLVGGAAAGWTLHNWIYTLVSWVGLLLASAIVTPLWFFYADWFFYPVKRFCFEHNLQIDDELILSTKNSLRKKIVLISRITSITAVILVANISYNRAVIAGAQPGTLFLQILGMVIIATVFLLVVSRILANNIISPIADLSEAIQQIADGDFSVQAPVIEHDELGMITFGFNEMARKLRQFHQEKQQFQQQLALAQEREKNKLANEIHDVVMSDITLVCNHIQFFEQGLMGAQTIEEALAMMRGKLQKANQDLRDICSDLDSDLAIRNGMIKALRELINDVRHRNPHCPTIKLDITSYLSDRLTTVEKLEMYRCIQQSLHNAVNHAHASCIQIKLEMRPDMTIVQVKDDGCGFNLSDMPVFADQKHFGLQSMRGRMDRIDGELEIVSTPAQGTRITMRVPL